MAHHMTRRSICPTLLASLMLLSLVAIAMAQQPKSGGTLRVAWEADITGMDPHLSPGIQSWHVVGNLFNSDSRDGTRTRAQPLWSFVPPGSRGHLDFGEQFPYDPEKAKALLKEAGFDHKKPLRYAIMTHGAEAALPIIATIMKTHIREAWGGGDSRGDRPADLPATFDEGSRLGTDGEFDRRRIGPLHDRSSHRYPGGEPYDQP
jgi:ABC-type transport system substrate-binding protein